MTEARKMLPDVFDESDVQSTATTSTDDDETQSTELPEDKEDLLNLVWQTSDSRREIALTQALKLQQSGQLHWYESARLLACRLLISDRSGEELTDAQTILPGQPPGSAHWFAEAVCDVLTDFEPSIRTALAVDHWLVRIVPNLPDYPELWFRRVLLLEHARQVENALNELRRLLDRYPTMSSALYRMGVVKYRQQDYPAARGYFQKALKVNPGLLGAMEMLRDVHDTLGESKESVCHTRKLRRKLPYSVDYLRDEVLAAAAQQSLKSAESLLDTSKNDFPERRMAILRARSYVAADRVDDVAKLLPQMELSSDDDDDAFEECLQVRLQVALASNDSIEVQSICNEGLARWPDSTRLKELLAEQLASTDPEASRTLLRDILCNGEPRAETAWQYLSTADAPDEAARKVVVTAPENRQQELAELFSDVTGQSELLRWNEAFLKWAMDRYPESDYLRWRLVSHYNVNGQVARSVELAEELYERNPDNPEAARMLGRCLIDQNPNKALPYLEKVCEQDRSVDYLFDLARCHQIAGNSDRSQELHWEILEQNPYLSASWTNLYVFDASRKRLWPYLPPMLERSCGLDDEYFLVAAVKVAIELGETLPTSWFPLAVQRWAILQTHPGFRDERPRLRRAILAWRSRRPQDVTDDMTVPGGLTESLVARFWSPRHQWIAPA